MLVVRRDDGRIVQEGPALNDSLREQRTFSEISDDSFLWTGESSVDDGRVDQHLRATRIPSWACAKRQRRDRPAHVDAGSVT